MCLLIVKFLETVKDMPPYWDTIAGVGTGFQHLSSGQELDPLTTRLTKTDR